MPTTPKPLHSFSQVIAFTSGVARYCRRYKSQLVLGTVIGASGAACIVGAFQLSDNWGQMSERPFTASTVGNVVAHTNDTTNTPVTPDASLSADTTHTDGSTSSTTVTNTSTTSTNGTNTTVTVNGQNVPVPANGSVNKTLSSANGTTSVQVSNTTDANANASVNIQVNSTTTGGSQ